MKNSFLKAKGFTLIELVVVLVIVAIMAAAAVPKFIGLQTDARISVIQGVEGALRSAATLVYSKSLIDGIEQDATGTVSVITGSVAVVYGYPAASATGIDAAIDISSDIVPSATRTFTLRTNCYVIYNAATSASAPATVSAPVTTGC
ncbi:MAG: prepilin-type N-terminal cleavage/methylation domain-containing protein [Enterobacterales bacterium]|nr:prepilin-type N-terminal cleavage/methylation domain-containing protein [Enterobacterales bacterium]